MPSESKIWLVTIDLPIKYIDRGLAQNSEIIQKDIAKVNKDLANAYEEDAAPEAPAVPEDMTQMTTEPQAQPGEENI